MDFRDLPINRGLERAMTRLNARQRTISENVAHADTPGYKARDVKAPDFRELVRGTAVPGASGGIERPSVRKPRLGEGADDLRPERVGGASEVSATGNDVSLQDEMLRLSQTQGDYAAAVSLYRRNRQLMRAAIGKQ